MAKFLYIVTMNNLLKSQMFEDNDTNINNNLTSPNSDVTMAILTIFELEIQRE